MLGKLISNLLDIRYKIWRRFIYYPCFANLNKLKVSLLHEEVTEIESIDFVGLRNSTKGLHPCRHRHQCRNLNTYPKICKNLI